MNSRALPLFGLLLLGVDGSLRAQDAGPDSKHYTYSSSAKSSKQSPEEIEDIGEIVEKQGFNSFRDKLRFKFDAREAYTTNALLQGSHNSSDAIFLPTLEAGFHTQMGQHFGFDLAAKAEAATYAEHDERSFGGYSVIATLDYRFKPGLPRISASVENYRYDSFDTGDLISQAVGFTGAVDWGFAFNAGRSVGFVGYSFTDYLADPNIDSRLVHRAVAGLAHQIRSNITGQIYYVYQYSDYTDFSRDDSKQTIAGNIIYQFSQQWFGSLTTSFISNDSTQKGASYESFSTTLGFTFQF
jgi:hypothetical protein